MSDKEDISYFDILNPVVEIELGGGDKLFKFKARKVGAGKVIAEVSARIISERIAQAREAGRGPDMTQEQRVKFLLEALSNMPTGVVLQALALEKLRTVEGTAIALSCCLCPDNKPEPTIENITRLVWLTDPVEIRALINLLCDI